MNRNIPYPPLPPACLFAVLQTSGWACWGPWSPQALLKAGNCCFESRVSVDRPFMTTDIPEPGAKGLVSCHSHVTLALYKMNGSTLLQFAFTASFECLQLVVLYPCNLPGLSVQGLRSQLRAQGSLSSLRALWHYHSQKQCVFFPPLAAMTCCCLEKTFTIYLQHHLLLSPGHGWTLGEEGAWTWGWTLEEAQRAPPSMEDKQDRHSRTTLDESLIFNS